MTAAPTPEISIVIPCLNESETVGAVVRTARETLDRHHIAGEVIVADNGSEDGSAELALAAGARVVRVAERGYGAALMAGIEQSRAPFILMADADQSYDLTEIPRFLARLREGWELVQGCRLPAGGGRIERGAMPWLHRHLGNPAISALARRWFQVPIHDVYCGMRAFTRALYDRLELRCIGMEFATEMVIKAAMARARLCELPITLYPDGRRVRRPHLKTFRDGWRTLRLFLVSSPRRLFLCPGLALMLTGTALAALVYGRVQVGRIRPDAHSLLIGSLLVMLGYQSVLFSMMTRLFGIQEGFLPPDPMLERWLRRINLERGLAIGAAAGLIGVVLIALAVRGWLRVGFGQLDYSATMRVVIPGATLIALGTQTLFSGAFVSILGMRRRR
ncbi:MAG: glycosyltransferase family 2 protein [Kiritimatiellae bacterium]|nr:glycosyltransferase family 2 protein [Kiritimatiellia bacterium]